MSLPKFSKQPSEVLDYDVDFSEALPSSDQILTAVGAVSPAGTLAVNSTVINNATKVVKVWLSAGTDNTTYKVTLTITTQEGRTKQQDFHVKVKEL